MVLRLFAILSAIMMFVKVELAHHNKYCNESFLLVCNVIL